ncbi:hypothetical protein PR048_013224 [Dryococelus australis]|uniref:HTH psq-type domain-containing protein n=1 Tax=Dryococelus australis TaxID=614101 RepID=A0ABQ9HRJ0_9NEOP|nr:hypothetical protein PR048_013224 [Dryococelus australis]
MNRWPAYEMIRADDMSQASLVTRVSRRLACFLGTDSKGEHYKPKGTRRKYNEEDVKKAVDLVGKEGQTFAKVSNLFNIDKTYLFRAVAKQKKEEVIGSLKQKPKNKKKTVNLEPELNVVTKPADLDLLLDVGDVGVEPTSKTMFENVTEVGLHRLTYSSYRPTATSNSDTLANESDTFNQNSPGHPTALSKEAEKSHAEHLRTMAAYRPESSSPHRRFREREHFSFNMRFSQWEGSTTIDNFSSSQHLVDLERNTGIYPVERNKYPTARFDPEKFRRYLGRSVMGVYCTPTPPQQSFEAILLSKVRISEPSTQIRRRIDPNAKVITSEEFVAACEEKLNSKGKKDGRKKPSQHKSRLDYKDLEHMLMGYNNLNSGRNVSKACEEVSERCMCGVWPESFADFKVEADEEFLAAQVELTNEELQDWAQNPDTDAKTNEGMRMPEKKFSNKVMAETFQHVEKVFSKVRRGIMDAIQC